MENKVPAKNDIAVLILFFCRSEQFGKVFEAVKKARPSRLYLYQDGARAGRADDVEGIMRCREIAADENIDWECEVYRLYQERNFGCDPSEFLAQKWMFETEEMGIILEDDDVPSQSFFPYCKELLERYKDNDRVNMICGMNNIGVSNHIRESYLFTKKGSIWGWASWKRVLDTWDGSYAWLDDPAALEKIRPQLPPKEYEIFIRTAQTHRATGREHYESINAASMFLNDRLNIVPKYNMISNIGVAQESTHSTDDIRVLPKRVQNLMFMHTYEIEFPLEHPTEMKRDYQFEREMTPSALKKYFEKVEHLLRVAKYKGLLATMKLILKRLKLC